MTEKYSTAMCSLSGGWPIIIIIIIILSITTIIISSVVIKKISMIIITISKCPSEGGWLWWFSAQVDSPSIKPKIRIANCSNRV